MALDPLLLEILACPQDKGPLLYFPDENSLYNPRLHRRYAINDGIPDMLIDDAETVSTRTSTSGSWPKLRLKGSSQISSSPRPGAIDAHT